MLKNTFAGKPTKVEFHVTVMSLDSINEGSMVSHFLNHGPSDDDGDYVKCHDDHDIDQ